MTREDRVRKVAGCFTEFAFDPERSRGRRCKNDADCCYEGVISPYVIDKGKIKDSKAWRRSFDKTQVFTSPSNHHVRTRGVHMSEVSTLAVRIASLLGLNVDLCESIADGHDIGHAPFGHEGEEVISRLASVSRGTEVKMRHEALSVVIAQEIERSGRGLNLTFETLMGIRHHSRGKGGLVADPNFPMEYAVVMLADKIAYTASDLKDTGRYDFLELGATKSFGKLIGTEQREMVRHCVDALILESEKEGCLSFVHSATAQMFEELRQWMYTNVYAKVDRTAHEHALSDIYNFFGDFPATCECDPALVLWMMSDSDVIDLFTKSLRFPFLTESTLQRYAVWELLPVLRSKKIEYDPDLSWGLKSN